ncbi:hypothetical protein N7519_010235 [Penicillium mononematosum]|uniref:uncharacterized protein n=1 Tax=Penicillium mononematosum TaxID=268346 RepID=UPI0025488C7D|nr:uncharacterized protein N7519_010235 [Penicillium mononematosum]KAJ6179774.1 hypothetical protein N7519_010235 [Penicillium mononematosum]
MATYRVFDSLAPHEATQRRRVATFNSGAEARLDGYLRNKDDGGIKVILETKRGLRHFHEPQGSTFNAGSC